MKNFIKWIKQQFFFSEVNPIIELGEKQMPQINVLAHLPSSNKEDAPNEAPSFESIFEFVKYLIQMNRKSVLLGIFFTCFRVVFTLCIPALIRQLLIIITYGTDEANLMKGIISSFLFAGVTIFSGIVTNQCFYWDFVAFQGYQRIVDKLIYRHMLLLNPNSRSKVHSGDVINRIGNDSQTVAKLGFLVNDTFYVISLFIGVTAVLLCYLGLATFAALGALVVFTPLAGQLTKLFGRYDLNRAELRESRLNLVSQILGGIRTAKLYGYTDILEAKIRKVRNQEVKHHISWGIQSARSTVIFGSTTTLVCIAAFGTRIILGQTLDSTVIFPSLGLLMLLELPFSQVPEILSSISSIKVAAKRILDFLKTQANTSEIKPLSEPGKALGVCIENISFSLQENEKSILSDINLNIESGEAVAVVGAIGSGKSVLLRCLLEEDERLSGEIKFNGLSSSQTPRIAYVPQEAIIFNGTLKENLLVGDFTQSSEAILKRALKNTTLEEDLKQMPGGLDIEIGERGINLSGGQKQRISLARAVIAQPGIAILDDPFSAIDAVTEEQIVENLIFSEWESITRIVATHRLRFLDRFDKIVFLADGQIVAQGTLTELLCREDFREFYSEEKNSKVVFKDIEEDKENCHDFQSDDSPSEPLRITEDETRCTGRVDKKIYGSYLKAMEGGKEFSKRVVIFTSLLLTMILAVIVPIIQNLWLVVWTDPTVLDEKSILRKIGNNSWHGMLIYAGIGVFALFIVFVQRALWNRQAAVAARILHEDALSGVVNAPIRFFDSTMSGVIMNRFSRDVSVIENELRWMFENMVRYSFDALANLILIIFVCPWLVLGFVPILWIYYSIQRKYSSASREIKRLVQVSQSPLFSHLRETFDSVLMIRTLNRFKYFTEKFVNRHIAVQRASRAQELIDRWFSVRVPIISGFISLISTISIFLAACYGLVSTGIAGIILTYLVNLWTLLNWSARTFAMVEGSMTSVERMVHLTELPIEEELFQQNRKEEKSINYADMKGEIEFISTYVRYAEDLPNVLTDVSFRVAPGSSVGIVGRTGSGKSTILQALVGMAEISKGDILIDGISIRQIPLHELRKLIAVILQDPYLFNGTIRMNLDPGEMYSDDKLKDAIDKVGLGKFLAAQPEGFDTIISESGGNLSQGQKQLLCFARALLKNPKIIIMDEATANVDVQTEVQIQNQLNSIIQGITVLIIAHRTSTVLGCNQIIRLSSGVIESNIMKVGDNNEG